MDYDLGWRVTVSYLSVEIFHVDKIIYSWLKMRDSTPVAFETMAPLREILKIATKKKKKKTIINDVLTARWSRKWLKAKFYHLQISPLDNI